MAKENYNTPYEKPACPTPGGGDSTLRGGGLGIDGLPEETANMSELGSYINIMAVKEAPGTWSQVAVEPGVASPAVPAPDILKKTS